MGSGIFLFCLLAPALGYGMTGKIAGTVVDQTSRDPLPGVTVRVSGIELVAVTGPKGEYFILNIPIGTYDVEARMIGYLPVQIARISVSTDLTTRADFTLQTTVIDVKDPVEVSGARPMIRPDLTASSEALTAREIVSLPVTDISELIMMQTGVVRDAEGGLHVRGGRSDEIAYYVDGASSQDPLLGGLGSHIQLDTIEELVVNRGGFDAQYGEAMSGVVNIVTRDGGEKLAGRLRGMALLQPQYGVETGRYDRRMFGRGGRIEGGLSGALPKTKNRLTFLVSAQRMVDGLHLPHHERILTTTAANLVYKPTPTLKFKLSGHYARRRQELYDHRDERGLSYDFNLNGLPERRDHSYAINLSISQALSPSTFYTARLYRYTTHSKLAPSVLFDRHWRSWPGYEEDGGGRYTGFIYETNLQHSGRYENLPFTTGDDYVPLFRKAGTTYYGVRFDINTQIGFRNQIRAGLETHWYRLKWDEKSFLQPVPQGQDYAANPVEGSLYLQDKTELGRFILNNGIRVDYFDTGQRFFVNLPTGQTEIRNSPTKIRISPRLGFSYQLTTRALARFSYGYFYQPPEFRLAYENLLNEAVGTAPVGNPNLDPQKTVAFETGLEYAFGDHWRATATWSSKRITHLTATTQVRYPGGSYTLFTNADFGSVQSLEFSLKRHVSRMISGVLNYAYSSASGSASETYKSRSALKPTAKATVSGSDDLAFPLSFDQRHTLTAMLTFTTPENWKAGFIGRTLQHTGLTLVGHYGSGLPFTPTNAVGEAIDPTPNSRRLPARINIDTHLVRRFRHGRTSYAFILEVRNLFNRRNIIDVYPNTGSPTDDGYTLENFSNQTRTFTELRRLLSLDPQHFTPPREFRFGLETQF